MKIGIPIAITDYDGAMDVMDDMIARRDSGYSAVSHLSFDQWRQNQVVAALSPRQGTFNANLMLAKIGDMYYRRGRAADARSAAAASRPAIPSSQKPS